MLIEFNWNTLSRLTNCMNSRAARKFAGHRLGFSVLSAREGECLICASHGYIWKWYGRYFTMQCDTQALYEWWQEYTFRYYRSEVQYRKISHQLCGYMSKCYNFIFSGFEWNSFMSNFEDTRINRSTRGSEQKLCSFSFQLGNSMISFKIKFTN